MKCGQGEEWQIGLVEAPQNGSDMSMQVVEALSGKEALDLAMRMFDMTNVRVIHSIVTDTKVCILNFALYSQRSFSNQIESTANSSAAKDSHDTNLWRRASSTWKSKP